MSTDREAATGHQIEEGEVPLIDFDKLEKVSKCGQGLVPVVVQNAINKEVLIVAFANEAALSQTIEQGVATFYSTSRAELWTKGATSGNFLDLVEVRVNCEQNSLLYMVNPRGSGACHTKAADGTARDSCYYRRLAGDRLEFI